MQKLLHQIAKEFQNFKQIEKLQDIYRPEIDESIDLSGFNMLIATLHSSNRKLSGTYSTIPYLIEREIPYKTDGPKLNFIDYEITNTIVFLEDQIKIFIPNFNKEENEVFKEEIEELFLNHKINAFSPYIAEEIKRDLGEVCILNLGKNILNYRKVEAIPNEYVLKDSINHRKELTPEEKINKEEIEKIKYKTFEEAQQEFFSLLYTYGAANPKMLQNFELYEIGVNIDLFIKSNNNAIIAKNNVEGEANRKTIQVKF